MDNSKEACPRKRRHQAFAIALGLVCLLVILFLPVETCWVSSCPGRAQTHEYTPLGSRNDTARDCPPRTVGLIVEGDLLTQASLLNSHGAVNQSRRLRFLDTTGIELELNCYFPITDPLAENAPLEHTAKVSCPSPVDFCVCSEEGECFTSALADSLSSVQFYAHCDPVSGCHIYAVPVCNGGTKAINLGIEDGLIGADANISVCITAVDITVPRLIDIKSSYIKAVSVSCLGCSAIQQVSLLSYAAFIAEN